MEQLSNNNKDQQQQNFFFSSTTTFYFDYFLFVGVDDGHDDFVSQFGRFGGIRASRTVAIGGGTTPGDYIY